MAALKLTGTTEMTRKLQEIRQRYPKVIANAMYQEAQIEMTESKRRVPVDTGTLRASGTVGRPVIRGEVINVTLSYGGAAKDYAIIQHERLDFFHEVGEAKFLESVLNESAPHMNARLARRINLNSPSVIQELGGNAKKRR